jgi:LPXTG-motif cell wall-anchored protein
MASSVVKRFIVSTGVVAAATFGVVAGAGSAYADGSGGDTGNYGYDDSSKTDDYKHDDGSKTDGTKYDHGTKYDDGTKYDSYGYEDSSKTDSKDGSYSTYDKSSYPRTVPAGSGGAAATTDTGTQALQMALGAGGVVLLAGGAVLMRRRREAQI